MSVTSFGGAEWVEAYVALGSNLENPCMQLQSALAEIAQNPAIVLLKHSNFYDTTPVGGPAGQPNYLNAAVKLRTTLTPPALLNALQAIEEAHGRVRDVRWGPRTLDLDILLYGDLVLDTAELTIPHPRMHERAFVLVPLRDVAPGQLPISDKGTLDGLLATLSTEGVTHHEC
ncbi:MAG: 2-amino-4-hydroxy-6-hydroxymethyldihydropteridine diphosphokinase [Chromatiales bacterium]|nr:2-amino-4-hydroxy-6-hydroxymethyldihydropteridine diphosphokinase [Chromatiales bacterium]